MVTVACVYKPGKDFTEEYVLRLRESIRQQPIKTKFKCLTTDTGLWARMPEESVLLPDVFPTWWNKIFLFQSMVLKGRIVYFDLDTVITGDISNLLLYDGKAPLFLDDFYYPENLATGVMSWVGGQLDHLYYRFIESPEKYMKQFEVGAKSAKGDQGFVRKYLNSDWVKAQSVQNGIVSYKRDIMKGKGKGATVVAFHGKPRPHQVNWGEL